MGASQASCRGFKSHRPLQKRRKISHVSGEGLEKYALPSPFFCLIDHCTESVVVRYTISGEIEVVTTPRKVLCVIERGARVVCVLHSFLDFSAPQASSADTNTLRLAVDQRSDWLEIGLEDPLGFVVGMTDVMARLATFATEIACKCHGVCSFI